MDRPANELRAIEQELTVEHLTFDRSNPITHVRIELCGERFGSSAGRRQDAEVRTAGVAEVAAPAGVVPLTRPEEVDAAQLEAHADIPDAVERRTVALVAVRQLVHRRHVWRNGATVRREDGRDFRRWIQRRNKRAR